MIDFLKAMAPVLFANLLTVGFVYACWLASKTEDKDRNDFIAACHRHGALPYHVRGVSLRQIGAHLLPRLIGEVGYIVLGTENLLLIDRC